MNTTSRPGVCATVIASCDKCIISCIAFVRSIALSDVFAASIFGLVTLFELARCGLSAIGCFLHAAMAIRLWCLYQDYEALQASYHLLAAGLNPDTAQAMAANDHPASDTSHGGSPRADECPVAQQCLAAAVAAAGAGHTEDLNTEVTGPATPTHSSLASPVQSPLSSPDASRRSSVNATVEMLFANVDAEQQLQDKEQALRSLAAAGGSKPVLTAEEKQALRATGKASQQAAAEQLAVQLQETDAAVQKMSEECRVQWFQDHACQTTADAAEVSFEDEWSSLPPEVRAMVQELQARP